VEKLRGNPGVRIIDIERTGELFCRICARSVAVSVLSLLGDDSDDVCFIDFSHTRTNCI
jgi:hypothetical protein